MTDIRNVLCCRTPLPRAEALSSVSSSRRPQNTVQRRRTRRDATQPAGVDVVDICDVHCKVIMAVIRVYISGTSGNTQVSENSRVLRMWSPTHKTGK